MLQEAFSIRRPGHAYIGGPMRGIACFNFDAFDAAARFLRSHGWTVTSPAEVDRGFGLDETLAPELPEWWTLEDAMRRDLRAVTESEAIFLLPGWEHSVGAKQEASVALWCGVDVYALYEASSGGYISGRLDREEVEKMMKEAS